MHLVEEDAARCALDEAALKWEGTGTAWEQATWVVLHDPMIGRPVTESGKTSSFTYDGARSIKQPTITLLCEVRGDTTVIHDARFNEASFGPVGDA